MKKKKILLKSSIGLTAAIGTCGAISTISSCNSDDQIESQTIYSITPVNYTGYGEFSWTATRTLDDVTETKTGVHILNSINDNLSSIEVIFNSKHTHKFNVNWIYGEGEVEFYINPTTYSGFENKVEWTATKNPPGDDNNLTVSGTEILTDDITSFTVDFEDGTSHTFTVDWQYNDSIQYFIEPAYYVGYENKVEWTATKNPPGDDNNLTETGIEILTDDVKSIDVEFEDDTTHTFLVDWQYTDINDTTQYFIEPQSYSGHGSFNWIATKNPPGDDNNLVTSNTYALNDSSDNKTKFEVTFDDGSTHEFAVNWTYVAPVTTYDITPTNYSSPDNTINWTARKYKDNVVIETITGSDNIAKNITSKEITFAGDDKHTFTVNWIYVAPVITFDINPVTYSSSNNTVNWVAHMYKNGSIVDTKTGTEILTKNVTEIEIIFDVDLSHKFNVNWIYVPPTITYDITPINYSNQDNTVNWVAHKYSNGSIVETKSGTETLTKNLTSFDVSFTDDVHSFSVNWTYVAPIITYDINPVTYSTKSNTIPWTANRYVNGSMVETKSGNYSLSDGEHVTSFKVTFNSGNEHTFNVDWTQALENAIVLTNGTRINITNPDGLMTLNSTSPSRLDNNAYTNIAISDVSQIKEFYITPDQTITTVHDNYGSRLCYGMSNLVYTDVNFTQTITSVGNAFAQQTFYGCSKLQYLPPNFNFPQQLTTVGNYFANQIFYGCSSLISLPARFNLPQQITSAGTTFAGWMLMNCTSLTTLPNGFNFPQRLSNVGDSFARGMFINCSALQGAGMSGSANLYSPITSGSYTDYGYNMFSGATILLSAGCPIWPTIAELHTGYNITRS